MKLASICVLATLPDTEGTDGETSGGPDGPVNRQWDRPVVITTLPDTEGTHGETRGGPDGPVNRQWDRPVVITTLPDTG